MKTKQNRMEQMEMNFAALQPSETPIAIVPHSTNTATSNYHIQLPKEIKKELASEGSAWGDLYPGIFKEDRVGPTITVSWVHPNAINISSVPLGMLRCGRLWKIPVLLSAKKRRDLEDDETRTRIVPYSPCSQKIPPSPNIAFQYSKANCLWVIDPSRPFYMFPCFISCSEIWPEPIRLSDRLATNKPVRPVATSPDNLYIGSANSSNTGEKEEDSSGKVSEKELDRRMSDLF